LILTKTVCAIDALMLATELGFRVAEYIIGDPKKRESANDFANPV
jgi:hypothetical protein